MGTVYISPLDFGLWRQPILGKLLGHTLRTGLFAPNRSELAAVAGWGYKLSGLRAKRLAARHGVPCLLLEDGFFRSVGLGKVDAPLSIVVDSTGIYYDAETPSDLERFVLAPHTPEELDRASRLAGLIRESGVSKYNHARDFKGALPEGFVLVVDQTAGDASISFGLADRSSFSRMIEAAVDENPGSPVVLKVHPEVVAGFKKGHFDLDRLRGQGRVTVVASDAHPVSFVRAASKVYTVTSQVGLEALIHRKPVRVFGMPFYAGWGLTADELAPPARRAPVSPEALFSGALVRYARYVDPETGVLSTPERVVEWLALQRRFRSRFPPVVFAAGFSSWKRPIVVDFAAGSKVRFVSDASRAPSGSTLFLWGHKEGVGSPRQDVKVVRIEDGFLRSVGLGADLVRPLSWVMDRQGIYYDSRAPSDLESLLSTAVFDPELVARAKSLKVSLCSNNLTKYNVGSGTWRRPPDARRVILVPGQVESDASLKFATPGVRRNIDLLKAVRETNPDAWVVYKPHPDVVAGLRGVGAGEDEAASYCDEVVVEPPIALMFDEVDEVHVLTSLAGFEALLRGRTVVTYGQPFYAGWGLTRDVFPVERRTRRLSVDELCAGVLFIYPTYVSRSSGKFTTPERALEELLVWRSGGGTQPGLMRRLLRVVARFRGRV